MTAERAESRSRPEPGRTVVDSSSSGEASILKLAVNVAPAETTMPSIVTVLKPGASATILYVPGTRPRMPKRPDLEVMKLATPRAAGEVT